MGCMTNPKRIRFASLDAQSILNDKSVSCHVPRRMYMRMCMYMYMYIYMYMYMLCIYDVTWSITTMSLDDFIRNQKLVKKCIQMIHGWIIFRTTKKVNYDIETFIPRIVWTVSHHGGHIIWLLHHPNEQYGLLCIVSMTPDCWYQLKYSNRALKRRIGLVLPILGMNCMAMISALLALLTGTNSWIAMGWIQALHVDLF